MSKGRLVAYREADGRVPLRDWLDELPWKARAKCLVRLERLDELGHALRRPEADSLRDKIHELRARHQSVNYRMLYFFRGRGRIVVSHGFVKRASQVPSKEIDLALRRMRRFLEDPRRHAFGWEGE